MSSHVTVDRLQSALTVTFHYLFLVLTMGPALFIAWFKTVSYLRRDGRRWPLRRTEAERAAYDDGALLDQGLRAQLSSRRG